MDTFFHLAFIVTFILFFGIRGYYHEKARKQGGQAEYKERELTIVRKILGLPFPFLIIAYMVYPPSLGWFTLPLPDSVRWAGVILGAASLPLIAWVQWALGLNFSVTLHVREEHTLVTHGPYKWVRHPMYTTLYLHCLSILLTTGNLLIGGFYLIGLSVIVILRVANEEQVMIDKFGEQYRRYMGGTGRFLPKLF
jgi:protein-S-isoprenylcysteine O-methyltransferase Ste14